MTAHSSWTLRSRTIARMGSRTALLCVGAALGSLVGPVSAGPLEIPFTIVGGEVIPDAAFVARVSVLGAAITAGPGGYHRPVTMKLHLTDPSGSTIDVDVFGPFQDPVDSNVNPWALDGDGTMESVCVIGNQLAANWEISMTARSWKLKSGDGSQNDDWNPRRTRTSTETFDDGALVMVLRDGDSVPSIPGAWDQAEVVDFVAPYIDEAGRMKLGPNDAVFLFELGATSDSSSTYDLQDLVVLVTLGESIMALDAQFWAGD